MGSYHYLCGRQKLIATQFWAAHTGRGNIKGRTTFALRGHCEFTGIGQLGVLGRIQNLQADDIAVGIVIKNHSWTILVAFNNSALTEDNPQDIDFCIVIYFHFDSSQHLETLLVWYAVTTTLDFFEPFTIIRNKVTSPCSLLKRD